MCIITETSPYTISYICKPSIQCIHRLGDMTSQCDNDACLYVVLRTIVSSVGHKQMIKRFKYDYMTYIIVAIVGGSICIYNDE